MKLNAKSHRWQIAAKTAATAAVLGLAAPAVLALSLGRIAVLSSLGEPLRAEIDVPDINAEEAATLKTSVALPDAFRAAGLEYNPAMSGMRINLQKRPDGRSFIRLSSDLAINDPFVDMIIEASWSSGRIVRDYTMLFDPPGLRAPAAVVPTPAQITPAQSTPMSAAPTTPVAPARSQTAPTPLAPAAAPAARPVAKAAPAKTAPAKADAAGRQVTVKPGDTASKIAAANKPSNVSLDQMLVALLRANPDAFIHDNINRIRSGAVMTVPGAEAALALSPDEAGRTVIAQSKDFNDFRKKLASSAPVTQMAAADRRASGTVQAKVEDKKSAAAAPDKLTLSKGTVEGKAAAELLAKNQQAKEAASRAAELAKNINELSKVAAASAPAPTLAVPASAAALPAVPVAAILPAIGAPASAPPVAPAAAASAAAAAAPASAPAAVKPVVAAAPAAPAVEGNWLDDLLANPMVVWAGAGLVALLAALGLYRARQRKSSAEVDSSFLESRLQPESFFGASGGQRVDTHDGAATGSSMVYSPSQLDAADDVDPVAEADVYLAYGRDLQAEEILKEALTTHPSRIAIHQKLLDIYAKRRDTEEFETVAGAAYKLTSGEGPDWERVCEMGLAIDAANPLYQPGGQPKTGAGAAAAGPRGEDQRAAPVLPDFRAPVESHAPNLDLDLDLDFSLDEPASAITHAASSASEATVSMQSASASLPTLDLDLGSPLAARPATEEHGFNVNFDEETPSLPEQLPELDLHSGPIGLTRLDGDGFQQEAAVSFGSTMPDQLSTENAALTRPASASIPLEPGMIEFDLGSLSLDLGPETVSNVEPSPVTSEDPLDTKLALAEEFMAIGDEEGARALIEEVIAESSGDMKTKAQRALNSLS
jgi:pilus assembly protein FimV